jgi:uncharacterized protein YggE
MKNKLSIDTRLVCALLLIVIGIMLAAWRPWSSDNSDTKRTIKVQGSATIKAEPDQFTFYPYFEKDNLDQVKQLNTDVVKALKDIGVMDKDITTTSNSWDRYGYYPQTTSSEPTTVHNFSLSVIVSNKDLAQKVQDYLLTILPKGQISPSPSFSSTKQKQLKDQANIEALADAKKSALSQASTLGGKLGKVISVDDANAGSFPSCYGGLCAGNAKLSSDVALPEASITIQPGQQEYSYTSNVTFELR